jgi:hypothetical protein
MAGIAPGETFYVQLGVDANGSIDPITAPVGARVATGDQLTVWHDF